MSTQLQGSSSYRWRSICKCVPHQVAIPSVVILWRPYAPPDPVAGWVIFWCNEAIGMVIFDASTLPMVLSIVLLKKRIHRFSVWKIRTSKTAQSGYAKEILSRDSRCSLWLSRPFFVKLNPFFPSSNVKKSGEHDFWLMIIVEKFQ